MTGADLPGEHGPGVHPDPHRDGGLGIEDLPHGEQHRLLVVAAAAGRAGSQDDLAAVPGDVGAEEAQSATVHRLLHDPHQLLEIGGHPVDVTLLDTPVEPLEVQERHRHQSMLGLQATMTLHRP